MGLSMPQMVGVKSLNRLEQVLLKHEAEQHGWLEALVTDVQGSVVEGVSSNCFILLNDRWISPELRYNGVHGVMRAEILARMQQQGMSCELRMIDMEEIPRFQSLFFCNALSPMKIAKSLNHQYLDVQPCIDLFHRLQLNQMQ
jgi:4-amino-4-deoxychorismate lyase